MSQFLIKTFTSLSMLVWFTVISGCNMSLFENTNIKDVVEKVSDGDTLILRDGGGEKHKVRLGCIDAPEIPHSHKQKRSKKRQDMNQFNWGVRAKNRLAQLIKNSGRRVKINVVDQDEYGRKVIELRLRDDTLVQEVLLTEGLAKVHPEYMKLCSSKDIMLQAQTQAQRQKIGIWGDDEFINPWEYRKL
ncbi:thermonuclease family protein [Cylindrospermopsis raciborskii CHAB3438]|uniref:thermonuclease family protein n=1 Tax=Cylindrospermopsis raciborskii TaxID=77022 RepID=UPI001F0E5344|nr:thermonuclease family protein [Cylindrospermopsis raciborskii]MCH4905215.1 thermonuclease family protein [Cylindrospermopsis raciborskii CHAB3438]MEB3144600.1 thermonuclease family protein [Cylindrospermopsis raciborskii]